MKQTAIRRFTTLVGALLVAVLAISGTALAATTPLSVKKTVPASNAVGVSKTANVKAYFNHDMKVSTITSSTFKIKKLGTTTWLSATRSVNNTISPTSTNGSSQSVVTLNPNADLAANTTYKAVVVGGSSGVKDLNGNALGANKSWTFTIVGPHVSITPNPLDLSPTDVLFCSGRQEALTVTNDGPGDVTFASVTIAGPDASYFSSGSQTFIADNGPFTVADGNHFSDQVGFVPGTTETDRNRDYSATLTYKDGAGARIGTPVSLTASVACLNF